MSVGTVILIVIVVVLLAVLATTAMRRMARRRQYGGEYDRLVDQSGRRRADAEFAKRRRRVDGLPIRQLSGERRSAYQSQWAVAQERFIDSPAQSVRTAAQLVIAVAAERGYPVDDGEQLLADLSVHHGRRLDGYRGARRTTERAENAPTEELRQALLGHRAMFLDLLGQARGGTERPAIEADDTTAEQAPKPARHQLPLQRGLRRRDGDAGQPRSAESEEVRR